MSPPDPYQVMPELTADEYAALTESIATFGVLHPVVVDEHGAILDGHHRARACAELGIDDYPTVVLPGLDEAQKVEQALALNLARRHLTPEQKRTLVADLRGRGLSVRTISEATGIPRSTVHRHASGVPGGTPEYVTGEDGKRYRAVRSDDEIEAWRRDVEAITGERFCASPDEMAARAHKWLPAEDVDWPELWFAHYLPTVGAHYWWRTGNDMPLPPLSLLSTAPKPLHPSQQGRVRPTARELRNRAAELGIRIRMQMGAFLNWAEPHGLITDDGELCPVDPVRFSDCACDWCDEVRAVLDEAGHDADEVYVVAVGHAYAETGLDFTSEVPA